MKFLAFAKPELPVLQTITIIYPLPLTQGLTI